MYNGSAIGVVPVERMSLYEELLKRATENLEQQLHEQEVRARSVRFETEPGVGGVDDEGSYTWWNVERSSVPVEERAFPVHSVGLVDRSDGPVFEKVGVEVLKPVSSGTVYGCDEKGQLVSREIGEVNVGDGSSGFLGAGRGEAVPGKPGLCYLRCFRSGVWSQVYERYGMWPDLIELMLVPEECYIPLEELIQLQCTLVRGRVHVLEKGAKGDCLFLDVVAKLLKTTVPRWLLGVVQQLGDARRCAVLGFSAIIVGGDEGGSYGSGGVTFVVDGRLRPGVCYLSVVRPEKWFEVYQELDEWPCLEDVLGLAESRYVSAEDMAQVRCSVVGGEMHVFPVGSGESGDCSFVDAVAQLSVSLLPRLFATVVEQFAGRGSPCLKRVNLNTVVGGSGEVVSRKVELTPIKGSDGMAKCGLCKKVVRPEGHAEVCVSFAKAKNDVVVGGGLSTDSLFVRRVSVGGAMHDLDVKTVVAAVCEVDTLLAEHAVHYLSVVARRRYLEKVEPRALEAGRNDAAWAKAFDFRYTGGFRRVYLRWFLVDYGIKGKLKVSEVLRMASGYSSLLIQVMKDAGF